MINLNFKKIKIGFRFQLIHRFCIGCFCPWIILVMSFILIMAGMSFFSISLHSKIDKGVAFTVSENIDGDEKIEKIDRKNLDKTIKSFHLKKEIFEKRKKMNNLGIIDPSS